MNLFEPFARAWRARRARSDWADLDAGPDDPEAAAEQDCINNGPVCRCSCPRAAHRGRRLDPLYPQGYLDYFDGPCSNPSCPGCPGGYWPGNGAPYESLFPGPEVYARRRRRTP